MNQNKKLILGLVFALIWLVACNTTRSTGSGNMNPNTNLPSDTLILSLLKKYPQYFDSVLLNREKWNVQIVYTEINRDKKGHPRFIDHFFNIDTNRYFYPASTVKLPIAVLALQKLHELNIPGLDRNSTMITETAFEGQTPVQTDASAADSRPSVAHYIKKIFLVSDNDAFNRLYEFLGQEYINNNLHRMGYTDAEIIHRLQISMSEEQNRNTNPVKFYDSTGKLLYSKPAERSNFVYAQRDTKMGKGFYRGDELIHEPFDFSKKNRISVYDLHRLLRAVMFPEDVPADQRLNLAKDDYDFLRRYMSMWPLESKYPYYDPSEYWNTYVKFIYYGAGKEPVNPNIRIFNKPGDAYGFMLDIAYVTDLEKNIEFMVSAVIHCNSDEIFNDDKYDYNTVGYPFMKNLGRVLYDYELTRPKKYPPDLSSLKFSY